MSGPAKVAKVKASHHHAPNYPSAWRARLRQLAKWMLIAVGLLMVLALVLAGLALSHGQRRIDCTTAAWHPDVPAAAKDQCRKRESRPNSQLFLIQPRSTS